MLNINTLGPSSTLALNILSCRNINDFIGCMFCDGGHAPTSDVAEAVIWFLNSQAFTEKEIQELVLTCQDKADFEALQKVARIIRPDNGIKLEKAMRYLCALFA